MRIRGCTEELLQVARKHRKEQTSAENVLWQHLRNKQLHGLKFRRQHPLGHFIVDFCCAKERLIVEVDGEYHMEQEEYDQLRTNELEKFGYQVIRFTNKEVIDTISNVLAQIIKTVENKHNDPSPSIGRGVCHTSPYGEGVRA